MSTQKSKNALVWLFFHTWPGALHRVGIKIVKWISSTFPVFFLTIFPYLFSPLFHSLIKCHSSQSLQSSRLSIKPAASTNSPKDSSSNLCGVLRKGTEMSACLECLEGCVSLCNAFYQTVQTCTHAWSSPTPIPPPLQTWLLCLELCSGGETAEVKELSLWTRPVWPGSQILGKSLNL